MWGPILGGFTILGAFLTLTAWINGRTIKRYIGEVIERESKATRELLGKLSEDLTKISEQTAKIAEQTAKVSEQTVKISEQTARLSEEHQAMLKFLAKKAEE